MFFHVFSLECLIILSLLSLLPQEEEASLRGTERLSYRQLIRLRSHTFQETRDRFQYKAQHILW